MTQPTHINLTTGTRVARIATAQGEGEEVGKVLVVYLDLDDTPPTTCVIAEDLWRANWQTIPADACPVCHGSGHDQIKKRKDRPCGGCFGLGKVKEDGETPKGEWEVAEVALGIIQRQHQVIEEHVKREESWRTTFAVPAVKAAIEQHKRQQQAEPPDWVQREQAWREGSGRGPGGRRHTGD